MGRRSRDRGGWLGIGLVLAALGCSGTGTYYANTAPTPEQHDIYFPISADSPGSHYAAMQALPSAALCTTCHDATSNTPFSQSTCTSCHTNVNGQSNGGPGCGSISGQSLTCTDDWHSNAGVGGNLRPDGGDQTCVLCHANDEVWRVADHATRVVGIPFDLSSNIAQHYGQSCLMCHTQPRDRPQNGHPAEPWATDFTQHDCSQCHFQTEANPTLRIPATDAAHVNPPVPGYVFSGTSCLACHLTGNYLDGGPPQ